MPATAAPCRPGRAARAACATASSRVATASISRRTVERRRASFRAPHRSKSQACTFSSSGARAARIAALVDAARDQNDRRRDRIDRLDHRADVSALRIVDVGDAVVPCTNSIRCGSPGNDASARSMFSAATPRRAPRPQPPSHWIYYAARVARSLRLIRPRVAAPEIEDDRVRPSSARAHARVAAPRRLKPNTRERTLRRELPYVGIVAIQNRVIGRVLVFEQAGLCASIVFEIL